LLTCAQAYFLKYKKISKVKNTLEKP